MAEDLVLFTFSSYNDDHFLNNAVPLSILWGTSLQLFNIGGGGGGGSLAPTAPGSYSPDYLHLTYIIQG